MFVDALMLFSDAQSVTGSAVSTNIVNTGVAGGIDMGTGADLYLVTVVDTGMTGTTSIQTVTVRLEGDSTSTITPDATQDLFTIPALSAAGSSFYSKLDPGSAPLQLQYNQLRYVVNGSVLTTGAFTSFITSDIQKYKAYADGFTIS